MNTAGLAKLELDPGRAEAVKRRRTYRLQVVEIPYLRFIGFILLGLVIWLHNRYILGHFSWKEVSGFLYVVFVYAFASWVALYLFFERVSRVNLGVVFLTTDVAFWIAAIYYTGGEKSLLFFLLLVRVADQANTTFRRAVFFSHVPALGYLIMLWYLALVEGRPIPWTVEGIKVALLYLTGLYISLTARTAEGIRERTRASMQLARELILELDGKTKQLDEAKVKAEEASRGKSEFIANMSHELRTPLNHIIGFTELVSDGKVGGLTEVQREYLEDVLHSSRHLLSLINDVLDLSKVEAGKLNFKPGDVKLKDVLEGSLGMIRQKAQEHWIRVETDFGDVPEVIRADERKLKQVMYNLLSNAVKFTPDRGIITVAVRMFDVLVRPGLRKGDAQGMNVVSRVLQKGESVPGESRKCVEITVSDSGIGIEPADLERIFEPFEQVESTASRRYQGTGLGLSLTRRLVELHGGKIWAESEGEGKGSQFRFLIPLQ